MTEVLIVLAIAAVVTALAIPSLNKWSANQRLYDMSRTVEAALAQARGEAQRTGSVYLVFFGADATLSPLVDAGGVTRDMLIVDDGLPGSANQNCLIDAGEAVIGYDLPVQGDVQPGPSQATAKVPSDGGNAPWPASTVSFTDAGGTDVAFWVMFRPDGTTRSFSDDCSMGAIGSGAGAVYLHNDERDVAVVLTALGSSRVHSWDDEAGAWTN